MNKNEIDNIISENKFRFEKLTEFRRNYNPILGTGSDCIPRKKFSVYGLNEFNAPLEMLSHPLIVLLLDYGSVEKYLNDVFHIYGTPENVKIISDKVEDLRLKTDFEYVAATRFYIKPKSRKGEVNIGDVPFIINREQSIILKALEADRLAGVPIRFILVKARQFGGSTLIQLYMQWIQLYLAVQFNSTICAQVESTARIIKGMYNKVLKYINPLEVSESSDPVLLLPYIGSNKTSIIKQRDCRITIGSAEKPDNVRGEDTSMAHCSEIALWKTTAGKSPEDIINSVCSGIPDIPLSMIVYESSAKGVGNFFHREYLRAKQGISAFKPLFISWFDSDRNIKKISCRGKTNEESLSFFIKNLSGYEWGLWEKGATLEHINWYRQKSRGYSDICSMMQEYPSDDIECFQSSGRRVFNQAHVQRQRKKCLTDFICGNITGDALTGKYSLKNLVFTETPIPKNLDGILKIWNLPNTINISDRYVVSVDIGGRSKDSDFSVIKVFDRLGLMDIGGVVEVAAQWRGHIDRDLLAWKASQISAFYNNALLIFESNTYETDAGKEGGDGLYILDELSECYENLYCRNLNERIKEGIPAKWGFQTNRATKNVIIDNFVKVLRDDMYNERDIITVTEMDEYEIKENGSFGAIKGCNDDALMCTMIGIYACYDTNVIDIPKVIVKKERAISKKSKIVSEAIF